MTATAAILTSVAVTIGTTAAFFAVWVGAPRNGSRACDQARLPASNEGFHRNDGAGNDRHPVHPLRRDGRHVPLEPDVPRQALHEQVQRQERSDRPPTQPGRSFKAQEQSLLHEFAHALVHARNRFVRGHGTVFQDALFEVATVWHGDPAKYDWSQEYSTVRQAAENRFGDKWAHDVPDVDVVWNDAKGDWE